jgi:hypothetical protein
LIPSLPWTPDLHIDSDVSAVLDITDYTQIGKFFAGFLKPQA